jgi:hypothetical protein
MLERAARSIFRSSEVGSENSDREFAKIIRDESIEDLVDEYVKRRFNSYLRQNLEDIVL